MTIAMMLHLGVTKIKSPYVDIKTFLTKHTETISEKHFKKPGLNH